MSEENIFEFPATDSGGDGSQNIPSIATFTQQQSPVNSQSSTEDRPEGPGYYVDTTVSSSSSSNDGIEGTTESVPSTPTEVIQHPAQPQDIQQQQLSATIAYQAAAAQQAAQLAANAAALQAAHAQQAMAEATSQQNNDNIAMSLHQTMPSVSMPMSCMANGVIASSTAHVTSVATPMQVNPAYSNGNVVMGGGAVMHVPMMQQIPMNQSQQAAMMHHGKGNKNMPPTPPASADEKDPNDPEKKKILLNMIPPPNVTANQPGGPGPVPVALMHLNGHVMSDMPGHSPAQHMHHQYGPPGPNVMDTDDRIPMPPEHAMYHDPMNLHDEEELSPGSSEYCESSGARSPRGNSNKRRNNKKPVPVEDKDDKYFERRKRNNLAAKRSRDARKHREDTIAMRANYLERENAILRAQLATLREEANSLRQLLSQRTMIGPNGQQMNTM